MLSQINIEKVLPMVYGNMAQGDKESLRTMFEVYSGKTHDAFDRRIRGTTKWEQSLLNWTHEVLQGQFPLAYEKGLQELKALPDFKEIEELASA